MGSVAFREIFGNVVCLKYIFAFAISFYVPEAAVVKSSTDDITILFLIHIYVDADVFFQRCKGIVAFKSSYSFGITPMALDPIGFTMILCI